MDYKAFFVAFVALIDLLVSKSESLPTSTRQQGLFQIIVEGNNEEEQNRIIIPTELNEFVGQVYIPNKDLCKLPANKNQIVCLSKCKWGYRIDHDSRRWPRTIVVASEAEKQTPEGDSGCGTGYECSAVRRYIPVLNLVSCSGGKCSYREDRYPITVAHVCTKKNDPIIG